MFLIAYLMVPAGHCIDNFKSLCKRQIVISPFHTYVAKLEILAFFMFHFPSPLMYNHQQNLNKYTSNCIPLLLHMALEILLKL